jgi:hypothetical protein
MSETSNEGGRETGPPAGMIADRTKRGPGARKEDWIAHQLRLVYDGAVEDAIPQQMLDLLNALEDPTEESEG